MRTCEAPLADECKTVAFVGFGEAAQAFVSDWADARPEVLLAFDIKSANAQTRPALEAACRRYRVRQVDSIAEALDAADAVFCLVTADQALVAAQMGAAHLRPGTWWFDGNSCAPQTKQQAAGIIAGQGGRYIDMAIMAPVHPLKHQVPITLSGSQAGAAGDTLRALGFSPRCLGPQVGEASAIKMIRSVMIKGMEALSAECFLAARRAGVDAAVLASLQASDPQFDWAARGAYNLERMMVHGARRAAEMREVVRTLEGYGLPDGMSAASAHWQDMIAALALEPGATDLGSRADRILRALHATRDETAAGQGAEPTPPPEG